MTIISIKKIGLVADYSEKGKWAFDLAFYLTKLYKAHLNIFDFTISPYLVPLDAIPANLPKKQCTKEEVVSMDRKLREYYDVLLEDYVDVGFKVCENVRHNFELRHCLKEQEYQLLIVPFVEYDTHFGNMSLEEFAYRFQAPVILVGPESADQYRLNPPADLLMQSHHLDLPYLAPVTPPIFSLIQKPEKLQPLPVL